VTAGLQPPAATPAFPIDIKAHVFAANEDDALREKARALFLQHAQDLFDHAPRPRLSPSMAGSCVLEAWAQVHSLTDIPHDPYTQLTRFDTGHLMGLWQAALLATILEQRYGLTCVLEQATSYENLPGHCDIAVYENVEADALYVVDMKWTYWTDEIHEAKPYQVLQTAIYALALRAPWCSVFTLAPGVWRGEKSHQHDLEPWHLQENVDLEIERLKAALEDEAPEGDPQEAWRCKTCSYSACKRNKNPRKPKQDGLLDLLTESVKAVAK